MKKPILISLIFALFLLPCGCARLPAGQAENAVVDTTAATVYAQEQLCACMDARDIVDYQVLQTAVAYRTDDATRCVAVFSLRVTQNSGERTDETYGFDIRLAEDGYTVLAQGPQVTSDQLNS